MGQSVAVVTSTAAPGQHATQHFLLLLLLLHLLKPDEGLADPWKKPPCTRGKDKKPVRQPIPDAGWEFLELPHKGFQGYMKGVPPTVGRSDDVCNWRLS
jgi:hypothetical protein